MVEVNNGMFTTYQLVQDFFHPYVFCKRVYGVRLKPHILGPYQIILSPPVQLFLVHSNPNIFCINKPFFINFLFLAPHKSEFLASEIPSYPLPPKKKIPHLRLSAPHPFDSLTNSIACWLRPHVCS